MASIHGLSLTASIHGRSSGIDLWTCTASIQLTLGTFALRRLTCLVDRPSVSIYMSIPQTHSKLSEQGFRTYICTQVSSTVWNSLPYLLEQFSVNREQFRVEIKHVCLEVPSHHPLETNEENLKKAYTYFPYLLTDLKLECMLDLSHMLETHRPTCMPVLSNMHHTCRHVTIIIVTHTIWLRTCTYICIFR